MKQIRVLEDGSSTADLVATVPTDDSNTLADLVSRPAGTACMRV